MAQKDNFGRLGPVESELPALILPSQQYAIRTFGAQQEFPDSDISLIQPLFISRWQQPKPQLVVRTALSLVARKMTRRAACNSELLAASAWMRH